MKLIIAEISVEYILFPFARNLRSSHLRFDEIKYSGLLLDRFAASPTISPFLNDTDGVVRYLSGFEMILLSVPSRTQC